MILDGVGNGMVGLNGFELTVFLYLLEIFRLELLVSLQIEFDYASIMCKGINKSLEEFYTSQLELNADDLDRLMIEEEVDVFIQTVLMEIVEVQLIYLDFMDLCTEVRYLIFIQLIITEIEILQLSQFHQVFKKTTQMQLAILQTYFYVDNREIEQ